MGYSGTYTKYLDDKDFVAAAIIREIGFYFKGEFAVIDHEVDLDKQVMYAAVKFGNGDISAFMFWYVLRNYDGVNILFDCEWEGCYYDWVTDFHYADCPIRIIDKLTPTDSISAKNWRNACRNNAAKHEEENHD